MSNSNIVFSSSNIIEREEDCNILSLFKTAFEGLNKEEVFKEIEIENSHRSFFLGYGKKMVAKEKIKINVSIERI